MKVNSVGNTNYSPNFGMKIGPKALVELSNQIGSTPRRLFNNTPDVISTIKKFGSKEVEMTSFNARCVPETGASLYNVSYKLDYPIDGKHYSFNLDRDLWKVQNGYGVCDYSFDMSDVLSSSLKETHGKFLSSVMESLANQGKLGVHLDKIKADFPNETELIEKNWNILKGLDEEAPKLLEIKKAEKAAKEAKKLEYRKQHPILSLLFRK